MSYISRIKLTDYLSQEGNIFVTGAQSVWYAARAIRIADINANLNNTRLAVSGYPGSPLANVISIGYEHAALLAELGINFFPALNERTAVSIANGTQYVKRGVAAILAFKAPGLAQSWDDINVASAEGAHHHGGVVMVIGDDTQGSSTATWSDSKYTLQANLIPVLAPSFVHEIPKFIFLGNRLSRHSGCWVYVVFNDYSIAYRISAYPPHSRHIF